MHTHTPCKRSNLTFPEISTLISLLVEIFTCLRIETLLLFQTGREFSSPRGRKKFHFPATMRPRFSEHGGKVDPSQAGAETPPPHTYAMPTPYKRTLVAFAHWLHLHRADPMQTHIRCICKSVAFAHSSHLHIRCICTFVAFAHSLHLQICCICRLVAPAYYLLFDNLLFAI